MIQDIAPIHFHNEFRAVEPTDNSFVLGFKERKIYIKKTEQIVTFLTWKELCAFRSEKHIMAKRKPIYLFSLDNESFFLDSFEDFDEAGIEGFDYYNLFETRAMKPKESVFAISTAWHLYVWYRDNQFCGRCGKPLVHSDKIRMLQCPKCQNMVFPKIAPAVIVGVTNGNKILLTKYAGREYKRYALIAGFAEIGETPEKTVVREVMEEVGLRVKNIKYYKSQPWGYDSNLLLGYFCELDGEDNIKIDEEELSVAEWVFPADVPDNPEGLSLTGEMMSYFKELHIESEKNK